MLSKWNKKDKESEDFPPTRQVGGGFHLTQLSSLNFPFSFISQYWQITEVCGDQSVSQKQKVFGQEDKSCASIIKTMNLGPLLIFLLLHKNSHYPSRCFQKKDAFIVIITNAQFNRTAVPSC